MGFDILGGYSRKASRRKELLMQSIMSRFLADLGWGMGRYSKLLVFFEIKCLSH